MGDDRTYMSVGHGRRITINTSLILMEELVVRRSLTPNFFWGVHVTQVPLSNADNTTLHKHCPTLFCLLADLPIDPEPLLLDVLKDIQERSRASYDRYNAREEQWYPIPEADTGHAFGKDHDLFPSMPRLRDRGVFDEDSPTISVNPNQDPGTSACKKDYKIVSEHSDYAMIDSDVNDI